MKHLTKALCILLTVVMLFGATSVYADSIDEPDQTRTLFPFTGTYASHSWHFDPSQGSRTRIKSVASYEVYDDLTLHFTVVFGCYTFDGTLLLFLSGTEYPFQYGPYNCTSISKSYSVPQAAVAANVNSILPSGYQFVSCRYRLKIDVDTVCNKLYTYMT